MGPIGSARRHGAVSRVQKREEQGALKAPCSISCLAAEAADGRYASTALSSGLSACSAASRRPYLARNFSTRPAVSTSFWRPVKNGWQLEQISTWISGTVERVSMMLPQAQTMRAAWYWGWIPAFMFWLLVGR